MNRFDLQQLAELRVREAKLLLDNGFYQGAYYLAGYSIECALKACISKQTKQHDFPDKEIVNKGYTHHLETLLEVAGLSKALGEETAHNQLLAGNWAVVKDWKEAVRYNPTITEKDSSDLYSAITDTQSGVLPWLKNWW